MEAGHRSRLLVDLANRHFGTSIPYPAITCSLKRSCAGRAGMERIKLHERFIMTEGDYIHQVVGHEVAHYIVLNIWGRGVRPHGRQWQAVMGLFGLTPLVRHGYDVSFVRPYVYACGCSQTHRLSARVHGNIRGRRRRYLCADCGKDLRFVSAETRS